VVATLTRLQVSVFAEVGLPQDDPRQAIQDAIDSLGTDGGIAVIGPGVWETDGPIVVPQRVTLMGCGRTSTRIDPQHTDVAISVTGSSASVERLNIAPKSTTPSAGIALVGSVHHCTISDVRVEDCTTGIDVDGYHANWRFDVGYVKGCTTGIRLAHGPRRGDVVGFRLAGCDVGVQLEGRIAGAPADACNDIQIVQCNFSACTVGIETIAEALNDVYRCSCYSSRFENTTNEAMKIGTNTRDWRYEHLWTSGNGSLISDNGTGTAKGWL